MSLHVARHDLRQSPQYLPKTPPIAVLAKSFTGTFEILWGISADEFIGAVSIDLRRYVERVARDMDAWLDACVHASGNMRQQSAAELLLFNTF